MYIIKRTGKFTALVILIILILLCPFASAQYNELEKPIPLGAEADLLAGLSDDEIKAKTDEYYRNSRKERQILKNILYNFRNSIDEKKYYGGAYFDDSPYSEQHLYILVTDMSMVPDIKNDRLHFKKVKYSENELLEFMEIINEKFNYHGYTGIEGVGLDTKKNSILINYRKEFDLEQIKGLIPDDSYTCTLVDSSAVPVAAATAQKDSRSRITA